MKIQIPKKKVEKIECKNNIQIVDKIYIEGKKIRPWKKQWEKDNKKIDIAEKKIQLVEKIDSGKENKQ